MEHRERFVGEFLGNKLGWSVVFRFDIITDKFIGIKFLTW
jgi:hypothetical protein